MKLETVYARFYKSFNFDHIRKAHPEAKPKPWEMYEGKWYPYIEVPIDQRITAVVGANESGKSHLLSAIEKAVSGEGFRQRDLCRYSPYFNVERGNMCWPHLGVAWTDLDDVEITAIREALKTSAPEVVRRFAMFREGPDSLHVYLEDADGAVSDYTMEDKHAREFGRAFLPKPFTIKANVALPNSVPLPWLANPTEANRILMSRRARSNFISAGAAMKSLWPSDVNKLAPILPQLFSAANEYFSATQDIHYTDQHIEQFELARNLLVKLGNVEPERLKDLSEAIEQGEDGHANALIKRINEQLSQRLNFPRWWVQDRDFSLRVTPRELDLVFTVMDRTGTEYTFSERSSGLRYFLSYLIQTQVHPRPKDRSEILLMDEPDTYLSAEAQQDLLKIFAAFAEPDDVGARTAQVVYVTHSPFLLDKNHAERIRVLQKGRGSDGTRVIRNASKNHYEPLRSAFGAFVGETAFVGACNLLVEGASDQIILAGLARVARMHKGGLENDTLDLNRIVIVPCGSASQIPYMVYLVRGRDADKPPVVVLLDSDAAGNEAAQILRTDKRAKKLLDPKFVLLLAQVEFQQAPAPMVLEDIVPIGLALKAANLCLTESSQFRDRAPVEISMLDYENARRTQQNLIDALNAAAEVKGAHIEKVPFARAVVQVVEKLANDETKDPEFELLFRRVSALFREINIGRRRAERESLRERIGTAVHRHQAIFFREHPDKATKENAQVLLEQIEESLDEGNESDEVRIAIARLKKDFLLADDSAQPVPEYSAFRHRVESLKDAFELARAEIA